MHARTFARAAIVIAAGLLALPASAGAVAQILPGSGGLGDLDARTGKVSPSAAQKQAVEDLEARVQWNRFGTPASLIATSGFLSPAASGDAEAVARGFLRSHAALFRMAASDVDALELVNDSELVQSNAHAVLFRQRFGSLRSSHDGQIAVGVSGGRVAYVSSSTPGAQAAPPAATLSATAAWLRAAANAGVSAARRPEGHPHQRRLDDVHRRRARHAGVPGSKARGRPARPPRRAADGHAASAPPSRPSCSTSTAAGRAPTARSSTPARATVLIRQNEVKNAAEDNGTGTFSGNTGDGANGCGDPHPIVVSGAYSIGAFATATCRPTTSC